MKRGPLLEQLKRYGEYWNCEDSAVFEEYLRFVSEVEQCCERSHLTGHCTGSAFVVNPQRDRVLLLFHPFLQRWLQPGGHADGNPNLLEVARREAHEETGLAWEQLHPVHLEQDQLVPFDLDIHEIPARKSEPEHLHYDLRYLLTTDPDLTLTPESEEMKMEWIPVEAVSEYTDEESVLRMVEKLKELRIGDG